MKVAYYPGCTGTQTSLGYDQSVREAAGHLEVEFEDIPEWTCCGASSAHMVDETLALSLPALNLARARAMGLGLVTPCPACSLRHQTTEYELGRDATLRAAVEAHIGATLDPGVKTRHVLDLLVRDVGLDAIGERVRKPLEGLKVVPFYGCYLVRPPEIVGSDDAEDPQAMGDLLTELGAVVLDWSYKVDCCGGSASIPDTQLVRTLSGRIIDGAKEAGASAVVTACPMCHANLDMFQSAASGDERLPVLYFSELMALAFGSASVAGYLARHTVDPSPLLEALGLLSQAT